MIKLINRRVEGFVDTRIAPIVVLHCSDKFLQQIVQYCLLILRKKIQNFININDLKNSKKTAYI